MDLVELNKAERVSGLERINDGLRANHNQFNFHVSITSPDTGSGASLVCSGAILSANWVLTAASCVIRLQRYDIRFASVTFYTGGFTLTSTTAILHPQFNPTTGLFNAALISLPQNLNQVDDVWSKIALPSSLDFVNQFARISGYGLIGGLQSPVLQFENSRVISNNAPSCQAAFILSDIDQSQQDNFLCAQNTHGNQKVLNCTGDVGSPIHITGTNNNNVLIGISISSANQACPNDTSLFVSLTAISPWIRQIVQNI